MNVAPGFIFKFCQKGLPQGCGNGYTGAFFEPDCIFPACRAADPAAVTPPLVNDYLFVRGTVCDGAELAEAHTVPAASALFRKDFADIFGPEHNGYRVRDGGTHGEAV